MRKKLLLYLGLIFIQSTTYGVGLYSSGDTLNVMATSGLRMRKTPNPKGEIIVTIPCGEPIIMLEHGGGYPQGTDIERIDNIRGRWKKASWKNKEGYVFDGYLSWLPAPLNETSNFAAFMKKHGDPITFSNHSDGERADSLAIQLYRIRLNGADGLLSVQTHHGWESTRINYNILSGEEYFSDVDYYLFLSVIFKDRINKARKAIQNKQYSPSGDTQKFTLRNDSNYYYYFPSIGQERIEYSLPHEEMTDIVYGYNNNGFWCMFFSE